MMPICTAILPTPPVARRAYPEAASMIRPASGESSGNERRYTQSSIGISLRPRDAERMSSSLLCIVSPSKRMMKKWRRAFDATFSA